jgi:signal peptidase I
VKSLAVGAGIAFFLIFFVIANAEVASGSMESTIMTGDRIICNRLAYRFSEPQRFDIILFNYPHGDEPIAYVKRIIGLPGETVEIIGGKVHIDNSPIPLDDSFVREPPLGSFGPFSVPEGHYFVLGDNRNTSSDSKSWDDPFISSDTFLGRAMFSYYPRFKIHGRPGE